MKISIILPTYNESKSIMPLVEDIFRIVPDAEIIIVDDNSPDGTGRLADRLSEKLNIRVIHRKKKLGLSTAVARGFKAASGDIIGVMDADLSHPPEKIPELLGPIQEGKADFVIGSRLIDGGRVEGWPFHRKLISRGATFMARMLADVKDPMSGLFFLRKEVIKDIRFTSKGYKICLEILVRGRYDGVLEVPYVFRGRRFGSSKLDFKEYIRYLIDWIRLLR